MGRRTKKEMEAIRGALFTLLERERPMTVRQVFYRMTTTGLIDKTENEYKNTVGRLLSQMRRDEIIPYRWIADSTRWVRRPQTFVGMEDALRTTARAYRRSLWRDAGVRVEIWLEKEALAGVLVDVTEEWDVPLYVNKGYASLSYLFEAAKAIEADGVPTYIYQFGDHDPSGVGAWESMKDDIRGFLKDPDMVVFERVAVLPWQIEAWDLPTRPTKKSDSRSKRFKGESVEVDAIPPADLKELARRCVFDHLSQDELNMLLHIEEQERETLLHMAENLPGFLN